jgi:prepilin-type processing-associated H-X9-DG protein
MKPPRLYAQWIVGLSIVCIGAMILYPWESGALWNARRAACLSNLKQIGQASLQYRRDYDGSFPLVSSGDEVGWANLLLPYSKSWAPFQCPSSRKPQEERSSDYFYNARLAQGGIVKAPSLVILFGDGLDNSGTNAHLSELPFEWKNGPDSPSMRHWDGANYAFADGHTRWLRPTLIDGRDGVTRYSFEVESQVRAKSLITRQKK